MVVHFLFYNVKHVAQDRFAPVPCNQLCPCDQRTDNLHSQVLAVKLSLGLTVAYGTADAQLGSEQWLLGTQP